MKGLIWLVVLSTSCTLTIKPDCGGCPNDLLCTTGGTCPEVCSTDDDCIDATSCDDDGVCVAGCTLDEDLDGVCDRNDTCSGGDDTQDADMDGVPDFCDDCVNGENDADADGDGVCDGDDSCPGEDDQLDDDDDGIADACDSCDGPGAEDTDRDGLCDLEDVCAGADDTLDYDDNDVPDCRQEGVRLWSFVQSTGWEGTFRFSTDDATDVLGTGSLFLSPENGTMAIQGPCYAVVPGERYLLAAMIRTSGQGSATLLGMNLYSDSTCQTGVGSGAYPGTNTTSWRTIGGFFDAVPFEGDAIVSAIRPTVRVDFPLATQTAQVDNVVIIPDQ